MKSLHVSPMALARRNFFFLSFVFLVEEEKNIFNYRCLDNKLKISTDLLLSNTSREVTSTSVFFFSYAFFSSSLSRASYNHESGALALSVC